MGHQDDELVKEVNDLLADALKSANTYANHDEVRPSAIIGFNKVQEAHDLLSKADPSRSVIVEGNQSEVQE